MKKNYIAYKICKGRKFKSIKLDKLKKNLLVVLKIQLYVIIIYWKKIK